MTIERIKKIGETEEREETISGEQPGEQTRRVSARLRGGRWSRLHRRRDVHRRRGISLWLCLTSDVHQLGLIPIGAVLPRQWQGAVHTDGASCCPIVGSRCLLTSPSSSGGSRAIAA